MNTGKCANCNGRPCAHKVLGEAAMLVTVLSASLLAALSLVALGWVSLSSPWLLGTALAASVAAVALLRGRPALWFLCVWLATVCWGGLLAPATPRVELGDLQGGLARLRLQVGRGGCAADGCFCEAVVTECSELEPHSCVPPGSLISVASQAELPLGGSVTALGKLKPRISFFNPRAASGWPDTRPDVQAALLPGSEPRIDVLSPLDAWVAQARRAIRQGLVTSLRAPHAGIARALILGEGSAVEPQLNDAIRNAGVSHVLAVSGMHVTLLVGALVLLTRWLWLRTPLALWWQAERVAAGVGVLLAPLIARLCGSAPSAVRAAWTSTLMYLVVALGLRPCALSVSALVVCAYAAVSPRDALHPGFVLSVLATAALLSHQRALHTNSVREALRESWRAWLSTAPFLLLCFGQTSVISLLANVALIPLGTALVPLAAAHVAATQLSLSNALPSDALFELASGAFVEAARFCAGLDPGLTVPPLTAAEVLALTVVACALLLPLGLRARAWIGLAAGLTVAASEWSLRHQLAPHQLRVTFLDVGQGDAALIETGDGHAALIDAGGNVSGGPDPGLATVLPTLRARRIRQLDLVVLSHPHPDHYGGLFAVLDALPVRALWDTGQAEAEAEAPGGAVADLLARARSRGAEVKRPDQLCRRTHHLGPARLEVLAPCPQFDVTRGPNDNSFVLRLEHGARSFLFTGDIERAAEAELTRVDRKAREGPRLGSARASPPLHSDVLKTGHHGSRTSSTEEWLAAVSPWLAVVSAGRANRFGHPHAEVIERLSRRAELLRTDQVGGIQVLSDGQHLSVRSVLSPRVLHR